MSDALVVHLASSPVAILYDPFVRKNRIFDVDSVFAHMIGYFQVHFIGAGRRARSRFSSMEERGSAHTCLDQCFKRCFSCVLFSLFCCSSLNTKLRSAGKFCRQCSRCFGCRFYAAQRSPCTLYSFIFSQLSCSQPGRATGNLPPVAHACIYW